MPALSAWHPDLEGGPWKVLVISVYKFLISCIQILPAYLSGWLTAVIRVLFFSVITFSAWIKTFPVGDFPVAFSQIVLGVSAAYVCYVRSQNEWIYWPQSKNVFRETFERELKNTEKVKTLQETIDNLQTYNTKLETEIDNRRREVLEANKTLQNKFNQMEKLMLELKKIELQKSEIEKKFLKEHSIKDNLNNTNEILETSVDTMTRQRQAMIEKQNQMAQQIIELRHQNTALRNVINSYGNQDYSEISMLTKRLETSLSSAKGKLAKVRGVLKDGDYANQTF